MVSIKFENISKQYRLGLVSTRTLSHDLKRWYAMNIQGKDDPYLKIGEVNDRAHRGESEYVWALKDINFKVEQGDVLGIIGKNGAGKSTLLKILSKVTTPSTGTIKARGRIASLLEVGTGFHPEMTGRENIYMNGAIMGMTKAEISRKFDEIVDFSGVERYIDTPAKRYSSGMTVRLGFAIAAHLDPEILVVDEVLAVGDAEFQKKAIGKMQDVSKGEGRTVLFVSHNMLAVKNLCNRGVLLENGTISKISNSIDDIIFCYTSNMIEYSGSYKEWSVNELAPGTDIIRIRSIDISSENISKNKFDLNEKIEITVWVIPLVFGINISISLEIFTFDYECVFKRTSNLVNLRNNSYKSILKIPNNFLNENRYFIRLFIIRDETVVEYENENILQFEVYESNRTGNYHGKWIGLTKPLFDFTLQ